MSPLIHGERDPYLSCPPVVQVPDGMTADEARQILADARPWVPLPGGPTAAHIGARVRREGRTKGGVLYTDSGVVLHVQRGYAYLSHSEGFAVKGAWFIHPDDVPVRDRDADLIDDLATALRKAWDANSGLARYPVSDPVWGDLARVAIERVRAEA